MCFDMNFKSSKMSIHGKHYTLFGQDDQTEVVLGLSHLQGAFYMLALGCVAAALGLLAENLASSFTS